MTFSKVLSGLTLFFSLFIATNVFAQNAAVTDVTVGMLTWVRHLNNDVDKYFSQEKGEALSQHLKNLEQDLTDYRKKRKALSDSLLRHNVAPGKKDPANLEMLKEEMRAVMEQMRGVTDFVSNELRAEGDKLNDEIYAALYGEQTRFLSHLEAFLAGVDVTKKDLAVDNSMCYDRLQECISLVAGLRGKIERKMKK